MSGDQMLAVRDERTTSADPATVHQTAPNPGELSALATAIDADIQKDPEGSARIRQEVALELACENLGVDLHDLAIEPAGHRAGAALEAQHPEIMDRPGADVPAESPTTVVSVSASKEEAAAVALVTAAAEQHEPVATEAILDMSAQAAAPAAGLPTGFERLGDIGRGLVSAVILARQIESGLVAALKVPQSDDAMSQHDRARLIKSEANFVNQVAAQLREPERRHFPLYAFPVREKAIGPITAWAFEYIPGDFEKEIEKGIPIEKAIRYQLQMCEISELLYERLHDPNDSSKPLGLINGDEKPNAYRVRPDGTLVLVDPNSFSDKVSRSPNSILFSQSLDAAHKAVPSFSLAFMSPEQRAGKPIDIRTTIHHHVQILYCMLNHGELAGIFPEAGTEQVPNEEARIKLMEIYRTGLADKPEQRYQTIGEYRQALEQLARLIGSTVGAQLNEVDPTPARPAAAVLDPEMHKLLQEHLNFSKMGRVKPDADAVSRILREGLGKLVQSVYPEREEVSWREDSRVVVGTRHLEAGTYGKGASQRRWDRAGTTREQLTYNALVEFSLFPGQTILKFEANDPRIVPHIRSFAHAVDEILSPAGIRAKVIMNKPEFHIWE